MMDVFQRERVKGLQYRCREKERFGSRIFLLSFLFFLLFSAFTVYADNINLNLTYGYQNTAKAGRFLPLRIDMENTTEETFTGYIRIYLTESGDSLYDYQYQALVESESESSMTVNLSLSTGVNQLLVTAEGRDGVVYGSKRIGLDVASSDAELILGLLSERVDNLSYLNGVNLNEGLLRIRTVNLNPDKLPQDETELDQLDMILISDFSMAQMKESQAAALERWIESGGILLIGTGARGNDALSPYYEELLREDLNPELKTISLGAESETRKSLELMASSVDLYGGRDVESSEGEALVSVVSRGAGLLSVSGYDFCDLTRFGTEDPDYIDELFSGILGESRLSDLSVSASEKGLKQYWDIESMMNRSDISKLPNLTIYVLVLLFYVILIGPGLRFLLRHRESSRMYRPAIILISTLFSLLIWTMGMNTRMGESFLTYSKWKDFSETSVDETDIINLRSPYSAEYGIDIKPEYYVYPILKGSDYTGDITELRGDDSIPSSSIRYFRDHSEIRINHEAPFTAKYFELHNKIPNTVGGFSGEVNLFKGELSGYLTNTTSSTLYDGAILLYGRLIRVGRLEPGESRDLSELSVEVVPVSSSSWIASRITSGNSREFLTYYLSTQLNGYFSNARLVGFFHDDPLGFTENTQIESYGITMATASLPLSETKDGQMDYPALSRDPELISGDYKNNSISGLFPTVLSFHLGEEERILGIRFENLSISSGITEESFQLMPFRGEVALYNVRSGGYDSFDYRNESLEGDALRPYLGEDNELRIRYTPRDEEYGPFVSQYLPMLIVTRGEL